MMIRVLSLFWCLLFQNCRFIILKTTFSSSNRNHLLLFPVLLATLKHLNIAEDHVIVSSWPRTTMIIFKSQLRIIALSHSMSLLLSGIIAVFDLLDEFSSRFNWSWLHLHKFRALLFGILIKVKCGSIFLVTTRSLPWSFCCTTMIFLHPIWISSNQVTDLRNFLIHFVHISGILFFANLFLGFSLSNFVWSESLLIDRISFGKIC